MTMMMRVKGAAFLVVMVVAGMGLVTGGAHQATSTPDDVIPQPSGWVAFSADWEINKTDIDGHLWRSSGRFYRNVDGSMRQETTAPGWTQIWIKNIPESIYYEHRTGLLAGEVGPRWTQQPMHLPRRGWQPIQYRASVLNLELRPEPVAGFQVYRQMDPGGDPDQYFDRVPDLNFFPIVERTAVIGEKRFANIVLEEPPSDLFRPPFGVEVVTLSEPGGIIATDPPETP